MSKSSYSSITLVWKTDPSAGEIPAHVHFDGEKSSDARPIGRCMSKQLTEDEEEEEERKKKKGGGERFLVR